MNPAEPSSERPPMTIKPRLVQMVVSNSCSEVLQRHLTSGGAVNFPGDIAGLMAGQEDEDRGELGRLSGSSEHSLRAELFDLLFGHSRGNKGSPHGTRGNGVDPHSLLNREARKRSGEADDSRFGRGIGNKTRTRVEGLD